MKTRDENSAYVHNEDSGVEENKQEKLMHWGSCVWCESEKKVGGNQCILSVKEDVQHGNIKRV